MLLPLQSSRFFFGCGLHYDFGRQWMQMFSHPKSYILSLQMLSLNLQGRAVG